MSLYSSPQEPQQFELFTSSDEKNAGKKNGLFSQKISLAIEHLIFVFIGVVVLCVIIFSIGVERGKNSAVRSSSDLEINLANSGNNDIITPSSEAIQTVRTGSAVVPPKVLPTGQASLVAPRVPVASSNQEIVVDVPVPAEVSAKEQSAPTGVYTVQVASFKQSKFASQEAEILKKRGYASYSIAKGGFYLVCVGKYKNKTQAQKTSDALKSKYKDNVIRRL